LQPRATMRRQSFFGALALLTVAGSSSAQGLSPSRCLVLGRSHVIALTGSGGVRAGPHDGKLLTISGLQNPVALAAGDEAFAALTAEGKVLHIGSSSFPTPLNGLGRAISIAAHGTDFFAALADGTVKTWSTAHRHATMGSPATREPTVPRALPGTNGVVRLSASRNGVVALLADGTVRWWEDLKEPPRAIEGVADAIDVAAGDESAAALLRDGSVLTWFIDSALRSTKRGSGESLAPRRIPGLQGAIAITERLVLMPDGTIREWSHPEFVVTPLPDINNAIAIATVDVRRVTSRMLSDQRGTAEQFRADFRLNGAVLADGRVITWWWDSLQLDQQRVVAEVGAIDPASCGATRVVAPNATKASTRSTEPSLPAYIRSFKTWPAFGQAITEGLTEFHPFWEKFIQDVSQRRVDLRIVMQHFFPKLKFPPGLVYVACPAAEGDHRHHTLVFSLGDPAVATRAEREARAFLKANGFISRSPDLMQLEDNGWFVQAELNTDASLLPCDSKPARSVLFRIGAS
jgi:hypothetical protein